MAAEEVIIRRHPVPKGIGVRTTLIAIRIGKGEEGIVRQTVRICLMLHTRQIIGPQTSTVRIHIEHIAAAERGPRITRIPLRTSSEIASTAKEPRIGPDGAKQTIAFSLIKEIRQIIKSITGIRANHLTATANASPTGTTS